MSNIKNQISKIKYTNQKSKILKILLCLLVIITHHASRITHHELFAQEGIVAIVNKEIITHKDLDGFGNFIRMQLSREYTGDELAEKIKEMEVDLLDKLIEDRLILQEAKEADLVIDDSRIKAKINEIKSNYSSDKEFQEDLARQGLVQADLENKIRQQLLMYYIIEVKVKNKVVIKPDEITAFFNRNKEDFRIPESRQLQTVSFESGDLAESFSYSLRIGQTFTNVLARYPEVTVNEITVERTGELREDVERAVFGLGIGKASEAIEIDGKYYIFRLQSITPARDSSLSEARETVRAILFNEKMEREMTEWIKGLRKKAYIKVMKE